PTHAVHRYYCLVDGGFMVNKTLEEWKRENPGVAETLVPNNEPGAIITGNRRRYILNQRFVWDVYTTHHAFGVKGRDERIVDMKNDNVLAKYIDFDTDIRALGLGTKNFRDMRVWLMARSCEVGELMSKKIQFNDYFSAIKKSGRMQNGNK
ncbi:MAG: hypothetical protein KZQ89_21600, partial [Candidatus Thiodiazotropha sp. (ex Lucinoma kastoroae)]|nr:hypothetical protein [Candidatus Thiodiazotropha sp. (ex Lucinoma kastoroae)]